MFVRNICLVATLLLSVFPTNSSSQKDANGTMFKDTVFEKYSSCLDISVTNQDLNHTNTTGMISLEFRKSTRGSTVFAVCLACFVILGAAGNFLVISSIKKPRLRNPVHMIIVNLSLAELLVCVIQIPMVIVNLTRNCVPLICDTLGILGLLLSNYTLHLQCLLLFSHMRMVTMALHPQKEAFGWKWFCFGSLISLTFDLALTVIPAIMFGHTAYVSSVGYCYYIYRGQNIVAYGLKIVHSVNLVSVVLAGFVFNFILVRYVKKQSAIQDLARKRHVLMFKVMFKKFIIWCLCYSIIIITRYLDRTGSWNKIVYQLGYFLLWANSVIRPFVHIFGKLSRSDILPCRGNTVTPFDPRSRPTEPGTTTQPSRTQIAVISL